MIHAPIRMIVIGNEPELAEAAEAAGVHFFMVDLEVRGKRERQRGRDTPISGHTLGDIERLRPLLTRSSLLVRINPTHDRTADEVEAVLARGADCVMLPMARTSDEVVFVQQLLSDRAPLMLLAETAQAVVRLPWILRDAGSIEAVHLGLNDLNIDLNLDFLFEPLAGGMIDWTAEEVKRAGIRFGFGGIGRIGEGDLPAELILSEHVRIGSQQVILSRTFRKGPGQDDELDADRFVRDVERLRETERTLHQAEESVLMENRRALCERVWELSAACSDRFR